MSRIKSCFISRWGKEGRIVQVDFSQLEVIGVAFLSQDPMMYEDINNGIDSHCQSAGWLTEHSYEEVLEGYLAGDKYLTQVRKDAKEPRFQLQYGSGAAGMAESTGITKKQAQAFIDSYYGRYSVLKQWQEDNISYVKGHTEGRKRWVENPDGSGYWIHWIVGKLPSISGRVYTFKQFDTPDFVREKSGILKDFSPTQVKNYPSQGWATADIVPMMLGASYRRITGSERFRDTALHIGTVHDSVLYDVHESVLEAFCPGAKKLMEQAPQYIKKVFDIEFDLPLKCEVEAGLSWDTLRRIEC